jgi:hypothetical protein
LFPTFVSSRIFSTLFCSTFSVLGLTLRAMIYFELILLQGKTQGSSFSLLHVDIQQSQHHFEQMVYSPTHGFCFLVKNQMTVAVLLHSGPSVPLAFIAIFLPIPHCFFSMAL